MLTILSSRIFLVGHETREAPWCLVDGQWVQPRDNLMEGPLDRHNCATLDVNQDGVPDVLCGLGAVSGTELGYNEVYVTNTTDGTLTKAPQGHGLDKFPTMRNRFMKTLKGADGSDLVFLATKGTVREDGLPNNHRMFRLTHPSNGTFRFREVLPRPWSHYTQVSCLQIVDVNQDGLDDIVLCNRQSNGIMFVQKPDASWETVRFHGSFAAKWRSARVADLTGDGIKDLVIVGYGGRKIKEPESYLQIFHGVPEFPYLDVSKEGLVYERILPYASPDVEVLDVNSDGAPDLYVVQANEWERGTYCSNPFVKADWWEVGYNLFTPPMDTAPDLLLVGTPNQSEAFNPINMTHAEPGCGSFVETFGDNRTLVLAQGTRDRPGDNLLLHW